MRWHLYLSIQGCCPYMLTQKNVSLAIVTFPLEFQTVLVSASSNSTGLPSLKSINSAKAAFEALAASYHPYWTQTVLSMTADDRHRIIVGLDYGTTFSGMLHCDASSLLSICYLRRTSTASTTSISQCLVFDIVAQFSIFSQHLS